MSRYSRNQGETPEQFNARITASEKALQERMASRTPRVRDEVAERKLGQTMVSPRGPRGSGPTDRGPIPTSVPSAPGGVKTPAGRSPAMTRLEARTAKFASMRAARDARRAERDARRGTSPGRLLPTGSVAFRRGSGTNDGGPMPTSVPSVRGAVKTPVANLSAPPRPIAKGGVVKKAAGGAAKVRKGMMTSEGTITHAMNKIRGK